MIADMYRRRMIGSGWASSGCFLIAGMLFLIWRPRTSDDWLAFSAILLAGAALAAGSVISRSKYEKVKNLQIPEESVPLKEWGHMVIKRDLAFLPQLLLFHKDGRLVGTVRAIKPPLYILPLSVLLKDSLIFLFPLNYEIQSPDGRTLLTLRRRGLKQSVVTILDTDGQTLGKYVQEDFKSLINVSGMLYGPREDRILSVKVKGLSGDLVISGEDGIPLARFANGFFPHNNTELFRDFDNDIVHLSEDLAEDRKKLLIGTVSYLFLERSK